MDVLLMGRVRRVSRVLFSFSFPMELMTMLPIMVMMIMMTSGIIMVWLLTAFDISSGVTSLYASPLTMVLIDSPDDESGLMAKV